MWLIESITLVIWPNRPKDISVRKYLFALILTVMSMPTFACDIVRSDLPEAMVQELKVKCEQMKLDLKTQPPAPVIAAVPQITRDDVSEWAKISQEFAKALGIAANEVGSSVNEFLASPAGILTAVTLIWMVLGKSILGAGVGILLTYAVIKLNRRFWFDRVEVIEGIGFLRRPTKKEVVRYANWGQMDASAIGWSITTIIMLGIYWAIIIGMMP
jgi:hypothetical protein